MISESLKINTTLTELNLRGDIQRNKGKKGKKARRERERERNKSKKRRRKTKTEKTRKDKCSNGTDTNIGDEGARMISESLKINTTLTKLNLGGDI